MIVAINTLAMKNVKMNLVLKLVNMTKILNTLSTLVENKNAYINANFAKDSAFFQIIFIKK